MAFLPHMTQRGSGHIVNVVSYGGLVPSDPLSVPYDTGHAALAVFTEGLARQLQATGVRVSIFCPGAKGPRVGQNTRSRGVGRLFSGPDRGPDSSVQLDQLASTLIEGLHHSRFLILGDPADAAALRGRWDQVDAKPVSR
jgi:short-subunit dehydrogenase